MARRRVSRKIVTWAENESFRGKLLEGKMSREITDKEGQLQTRNLLQFEVEGEVILVWEDSGLKNALAWADIKIGDDVEFVKLAKKDLGEGRSVNQYDVFIHD